MEIAFNWGFDADCNAATLASILGVIRGYNWFMEQGWDIGDKYCNTTRPGMPMEETISSFSDRILRLAARVINENEGRQVTRNGKKVFEIKMQEPSVIRHIENEEVIFASLYAKYHDEVISVFEKNSEQGDLARAAYLSFCLKIADDMRDAYPVQWKRALWILESEYKGLMHVMSTSGENYIKSVAQYTGLTFPLALPSLDGKYEFRLAGYQDARQVSLGGTMNHWKSWNYPMLREEGGWVCRIDMKPGKYEYKFIVDGQPIFDPSNDVRETNCEYRTNSIFIAE